jgi:hypothetical protein
MTLVLTCHLSADWVEIGEQWTKRKTAPVLLLAASISVETANELTNIS